MRHITEPLNWRSFLSEEMNVDALDNDFVIFDTIKANKPLNHPFRLDVVVTIICLQGECQGKIDLMPQTIEAYSMTVMLPNTILEYSHVSDDFKGYILLMSPQFLQSLNIEEWISSYANIREKPYIRINKEALDALVNYCHMCQGLLSIPNHPYKKEALRNLTRAFFYGAGYFFHNMTNDYSKREPILKHFLKLVKQHYHQERSLDFYAAQLSLSTKYMSSKIKHITGKTASQIIDSYVIMEAKSLLINSNMNVQQVSDYLNFPSQSFFGKYFKRLVGISPKVYKNRGELIDTPLTT